MEVKTNNIETLLRGIETQLIASLFQDVENFEIVNEKSSKIKFTIPAYNNLYNIARILYTQLHYTNIDKIAIDTYCATMNLSSSDALSVKTWYDLIKSRVEKEKIDFNGTFEHFSMISSVYKYRQWHIENGGLDGVVEKLLKLGSSEKINTVIDGRITEFFTIGTQDSELVETDLTEKIDNEYIKNLRLRKTIESVPFLKHNYYLNRFLKGMVRGVNGIAGFSGTGKSSWLVVINMMGALENSKDKICLFCNEQVYQVFLNNLLFAYMSTILYSQAKQQGKEGKLMRLSRDRLTSGTLTDDEIEYLIKIAEIVKKRYAHRITHVYFENMTTGVIKKEVRKKYRAGYRHFFYDTFKDTEEEYKNIIILSTTIDKLTKKYNIIFTITLQIAGEHVGVKYLTYRHLARAKAIKDILENLLLFRKLDKEELAYLKVYKITKDGKQSVPLNLESSNYYAIFIDKNRNGEGDLVLLYEIFLDRLIYNEIGIIDNMPKDTIIQFNRKK